MHPNDADILCPQVKHDIKARLTLSATGAEGGEGPRTHVQVLANSVVATVLSILHTIVLARNPVESCFSLGHNAADILMVGIVAYVVDPHRSCLEAYFLAWSLTFYADPQ